MKIKESQLRKIIHRSILNEFKIYKGDKGLDKTQQADWDKQIKCPKCGGPMYFHLCLNDESGEKEQIGTVDENGKVKDTEYQTLALYFCPKCFKWEVRSNMA